MATHGSKVALLIRDLSARLARALSRRFPTARTSRVDAAPAHGSAAPVLPRRLEVAAWDLRDGLLVGVRILHPAFSSAPVRDIGSAGGSDAISPVVHALRRDAASIHRRQPYAVLVGIVLVPADLCESPPNRSRLLAALARCAGRHANGDTAGAVDTAGDTVLDTDLDRLEALFVLGCDDASLSDASAPCLHEARLFPNAHAADLVRPLSLDQVVRRIERTYDLRRRIACR